MVIDIIFIAVGIAGLAALTIWANVYVRRVTRGMTPEQRKANDQYWCDEMAGW